MLYNMTKSEMFVSTHSRPKAAGLQGQVNKQSKQLFQHTAARRRLALHHQQRQILP